jgi:phage tail tape measure protein, TP901 family, core region
LAGISIDDLTSRYMKLKSEMDAAGGKVPLDGSWAKEYQKLMSDVVASTKRVTAEQKKAEKSSQSFFASLKKNFSFLSYWTSASYILMTSIRKIKEMVGNVRELEDALVNINYTMELSGRQLKEIGESSLQMAKDMNTSASNVLSAVKLYANAKESADSILQKSQPAIMISNVTGMTGEDSAKMLQSIMNQFDMTQDDLMEIADTIEMVSQNMAYDFASGIDEIAKGIEQSGSVAKSAGLSLQEYVSMLGLVIEKTGQSGNTIGNAYKTILQRITKSSATEGTLEEDISAAEKSLRAVGVEVRDTADEFRDLTDIMSDLGKVWDSLSSVEQSNISYNVAGVRQTNILKSLLGYWEDYESLVEKANGASGTTLKNQEIYADSLQGKLGELTSIWENISNDTISSNFLKGLADAGIGISSLIEKIGLLKIAGVGAFAFINKGRSKQRFCPVGW